MIVQNCYSASVSERVPLAGYDYGEYVLENGTYVGKVTYYVYNNQISNSYFDKSLSPNYNVLGSEDRGVFGRTSNELKTKVRSMDGTLTLFGQLMQMLILDIHI